MKLRAYQERTVDAVVSHLRNNVMGVLIQAPCGAGKTEIAMEIMRQVQRRWLVVLHTNVLVEQTERRLRELGLEVERYGINGHDPEARIVVASVQSLIVNDATKELKPDCICYDEAHHYEAETWSCIAERYPYAVRVGMTATPQRRDGKSLMRHFDQLVVAAKYSELIKSGVLVGAHVWAPTISVPSGLARDPIEAWNELSEGMKTIVAFGRVDEARLWAERFNSVLGPLGKRAACVDGESNWSYNQQILREFVEGKLDVLTNVYYITEGFDLPDVGCVIFARRFQFRATYMQFAGRALRSAPGKDHATIIDLTGCTWAHGLPHSDRPWSLEDNEIASSDPDRDEENEGTGAKRKHLDVSGEGVICVCPVSYETGDTRPHVPERQPIVANLKVSAYRGAVALVAIEKKVRAKAGKWSAAIARKWSERERKRAVRISRQQESEA